MSTSSFLMAGAERARPWASVPSQLPLFLAARPAGACLASGPLAAGRLSPAGKMRTGPLHWPPPGHYPRLDDLA